MRWLPLALAIVSLPAVASADPPPPRARIAATIDGSVGRSWLFGVHIDELAAHGGVGANFRLGSGRSNSLDVLGLVSLARGRTEAGRPTRLFGVGATVIFHVHIVRLGAGLEIGSFIVDTPMSDSGSPLMAQVHALVGIEPFELGPTRPFLDLRAHARGWAEGESMKGVSLALGIRY